MTDAASTLAAMRASVAREAAEPERVARTSAQQIGESLTGLGLAAEDVEEASAHWRDLASRSEWCDLLAGVLAQVQRQQGQPDEPVAIWDDLDGAGDLGRLFYLYVAALSAGWTATYLGRSGFPSEVIAQSLGTLARHVRVHRDKRGTLGVDAGWWILLMLRGDLVTVGALQYHRVNLGRGTLSPQPWYDERAAADLGAGFRAGDASVGLHIPDGADLSARSVACSLAAARDLLDRCWPVSQRRLVTCQSWMLDERLGDWLDATSNLVRFGALFTLVPGWLEGDEDVREFVFRPRASGPSTLQGVVAGLFERGEHWHVRTGWLAWERR